MLPLSTFHKQVGFAAGYPQVDEVNIPHSNLHSWFLATNTHANMFDSVDVTLRRYQHGRGAFQSGSPRVWSKQMSQSRRISHTCMFTGSIYDFKRIWRSVWMVSRCGPHLPLHSLNCGKNRPPSSSGAEMKPSRDHLSHVTAATSRRRNSSRPQVTSDTFIAPTLLLNGNLLSVMLQASASDDFFYFLLASRSLGRLMNLCF